ncbi:MAG: endonuclease/exonuclease/phosphatase family protein [Bacteroidales bacterium]|jgi:endonuclease/exonuclease/phosphatase family metal-dependent hydrolase|nr:endonuclease/exonuclease/phosphatase family protein [Bacteroidales bacterium]
MKQKIILQKGVFVAFFSFLLFIHVGVNAQQKQYKVATVAFYNLENLFDTLDTPDKNDLEYTPEGSNNWDSKKYFTKLENLAEVISQIGSDLTGAPPAIVGVSELENRAVLEDLVNQPQLKSYDYQIVHYESPDRRGIDVALIYQSALFEVVDTHSAELTIEGKDDFHTRDQLVVSGILDGEKIHFIVNHWPSRYGGEARSKPLRNAAADLTRSLVDSIMNIQPDAKIMIMGDLNDDPVDESIMEHLDAKKSERKTRPGDLFNPFYDMFKKGYGTLAYRDQWNLFDQIIVSYSLLGEDKSTFKLYQTRVFDRDFLKRESGRYKGYPFRTHAAGIYMGGYSDHFPVYAFLIKEIE